MRHTLFIAVTILLLASCGQKKDAVSTQTPPSPPASPVVAPMPDVGKMTSVTVESDGFGKTAGAAVNEAMRLAILQVNGAAIDQSSISAKFGLDITDGQDSASIRSTAFAELVSQHSNGAISNFKIVNIELPNQQTSNYKATIQASISKFSAPKDNKIKIVVAPIHVNSQEFSFGDNDLPATQLVNDIHQRLVDALTNTGRFSVLDRDFGSEVNQELSMITSGQAPKEEIAKLGQDVTADVIWAGDIQSFAYNKHERKLITSNRDLESYSGGWSISQRIINTATRQIMVSNTLQGDAPSIAPTTLGTNFDPTQTLQSMEQDIVNDIVSEIVARTFPITVVSRNGNNVVLSQGGQLVKEGSSYSLVYMGSEIKDPQTGQSLGFTESPCCDVVIDRVDPNLSYGHLENVKISLDNIKPGGLEVRGTAKIIAQAPAISKVGPAEDQRDDESKRTHKSTKTYQAQLHPTQKGNSIDKNW